MKENSDEEFFCLNYELKTLSELYFYNKAERWVKGFMHKTIEEEHLDRYKFACDYVEEKEILDMACGSGYGGWFLMKEGKAKSIVGVDIDAEAIRYGNYRYFDKNIEREVADATRFNTNKKFDVITSFETIEHIPDYQMLIKNLHNNLKEDGILLISTPITNITNRIPENKYHVIEWSFYDFHKIFKELFKIEKIIVQNVLIESNVWKVPSLIKKIKNRIFQDKTIYNIKGKSIEEFKNQYNMDKCIAGYQLLVLKKK